MISKEISLTSLQGESNNGLLKIWASNTVKVLYLWKDLKISNENQASFGTFEMLSCNQFQFANFHCRNRIETYLQDSRNLQWTHCCCDCYKKVHNSSRKSIEVIAVIVVIKRNFLKSFVGRCFGRRYWLKIFTTPLYLYEPDSLRKRQIHCRSYINFSMFSLRANVCDEGKTPKRLLCHSTYRLRTTVEENLPNNSLSLTVCNRAAFRSSLSTNQPTRYTRKELFTSSRSENFLS